METKELRFRKDASVRVGEVQDKPKTLTGYAVVYNSPSEDLGGFTEIILPGAFSDSLKENDIRALVDHKWGRLLGRQSSGTLRLFDEEKGLRYEIDLPDTQDGRDVYTLVERGDLSGMSFLMDNIQAEWRDGIRYIVKADIFEISCVSLPAYSDTSAALRSLEQHRAETVKDQIRKARLELAEKSYR